MPFRQLLLNHVASFLQHSLLTTSQLPNIYIFVIIYAYCSSETLLKISNNFHKAVEVTHTPCTTLEQNLKLIFFSVLALMSLCFIRCLQVTAPQNLIKFYFRTTYNSNNNKNIFTYFMFVYIKNLPQHIQRKSQCNMPLVANSVGQMITF